MSAQRKQAPIDPMTVPIGTAVEVWHDVELHGGTCITCGQRVEKSKDYRWIPGRVDAITTIETATGIVRHTVKIVFDGARGYRVADGHYSLGVTAHVSLLKLREVAP